MGITRTWSAARPPFAIATYTLSPTCTMRCCSTFGFARQNQHSACGCISMTSGCGPLGLPWPPSPLSPLACCCGPLLGSPPLWSMMRIILLPASICSLALVASSAIAAVAYLIHPRPVPRLLPPPPPLSAPSPPVRSRWTHSISPKPFMTLTSWSRSMSKGRLVRNTMGVSLGASAGPSTLMRLAGRSGRSVGGGGGCRSRKVSKKGFGVQGEGSWLRSAGRREEPGVILMACSHLVALPGGEPTPPREMKRHGYPLSVSYGGRW
mmetsp:Transcript_2259/g.6111  ORF Transcript_2259/g.6111 Transcript_2259/m.6111 type:complete len:265 (+) Transcript_2259:708-1502(+)